MRVIQLVKFEGEIIETTVTNEAKVADEWIESISKLLQQQRRRRIIGMSCKFIHHPILSLSNKTALLVLCFQTKCLILQLLHMDSSSIPHSLLHFLTHPNTTFAGIDIHHHSHKLLQDYALRVNRMLDVHFLASKWFPASYKGRPSFKALAHGILGFSMRRKSGDVKGNWESRILDTELVEQACVDDYTSYTIADTLIKDRYI